MGISVDDMAGSAAAEEERSAANDIGSATNSRLVKEYVSGSPSIKV